MKQTTRIFIGLSLPDTVKDKITTINTFLPNIKWVPQKNYHITLKFIGHVDQDQLQHIENLLSQIDFPSFSLNLKSVGCFYKKNKPYVLWVGVKENKILNDLQNLVEEKLRGLDFTREETRSYNPHVTLARLKQKTKSEIEDYIKNFCGFSTEDILIDSFHIFESRITPNGVKNFLLKTFELKN